MIDTSRGVAQAVGYVQRYEQQSVIGISTITQLELLVGCRNKVEQRQVERFLQRFENLRLNEAIADRGVQLVLQYRLSHGLLLADGLIAATALVLNLPLATNNQRDYRFIAGLQLVAYP